MEGKITPWWTEPQTERITDMISVCLVNFFMPRKPLSCWRDIVMAAPPIKPTMAAWDRKSIKNPNLITKPNNHHLILELWNMGAFKTDRTIIWNMQNHKKQLTYDFPLNFQITSNGCICWLPEKSKCGLSNPSKKCSCECKPQILCWIFVGVNLSLKQTS